MDTQQICLVCEPMLELASILERSGDFQVLAKKLK